MLLKVVNLYVPKIEYLREKIILWMNWCLRATGPTGGTQLTPKIISSEDKNRTVVAVVRSQYWSTAMATIQHSTDLWWLSSIGCLRQPLLCSDSGMVCFLGNMASSSIVKNKVWECTPSILRKDKNHCVFPSISCRGDVHEMFILFFGHCNSIAMTQTLMITVLMMISMMAVVAFGWPGDLKRRMVMVYWCWR